MNPRDFSKVAVVLTTWNSERFFDKFPEPLLRQGIAPEHVLIVDSESKDGTVARARSFGFRVYETPRSLFNHGGSRALAVSVLEWAEILVFTTPDAIMAHNDTLANLLSVFDDPDVGAAYGRQLPHADADPFAQIACAFNYPETSIVRSFESRKTMGFKAIFLSNNLAAYRRTALEEVGNFPRKIITGEDTYVAAKLMSAGWKTAYVADALVYHSHNQTLPQLFRRYFDTGVMHDMEPWMRQQYGEPSGEGLRFVGAEIKYISQRNILLVPKIFLRTAAKFLGYRLGRRQAKLSVSLKKSIGNLPEFWTDSEHPLARH